QQGGVGGVGGPPLNSGAGLQGDDAASASWTVGDFNGDGCTDLAVSEPAYRVGTATATQAQIQLLYSNAAGTERISIKGWQAVSTGDSAGKGEASVGDFAGEGKDSIVWRESSDPLWLASQPAPLVLFKSNGPAPDLMTVITASM